VQLIGLKENNKTFGESVKSAKGFYDLYRQALNKMELKDYETAIKLLNESLPYVGIIIERDMVYTSLAEVYRAQGNLEQELKYLEAVLSSIPKDAPPSDVRDKNYKRVTELRQLLAKKSVSLQKTNSQL